MGVHITKWVVYDKTIAGPDNSHQLQVTYVEATEVGVFVIAFSVEQMVTVMVAEFLAFSSQLRLTYQRLQHSAI